ncbi:tetratricopeptide (TPR) repeat protein [Sagittula marina]|uniref:Tetratricopeptide (TPR) repeat protein n=1 Tax=Sagittula marina TaxID=943940 RepID=A0A7W6DPQ8_9RHOB|nr:tetratricopeptide repeat protein [Sagittula marina]MBB3986903.1 tetratricopeptide (TPR) repeat protein [Sagittula marina]
MTHWASGIRATLRASTFAVAAAFATVAPAQANGIAGDYLAARQASFLGDFKAAAHYYGRALAFAPDRPELLERAILAEMSLGDFDRASALADRMEKGGFDSQVARMATIATEAGKENYTTIIKAIDEERAIGPLADGLVKAWALLGTGDMSAALLAFDEVADMQGLAPFAAYHKALALASVGDFVSSGAIFEEDQAGGMAATRRGVMARSEILSQLGRSEEALELLDTSFGTDLDPELKEMRSALEAGDRLPFTHVRTPKDGIAEVFYTLAGALSNEGSDELTLLYSRMAEHLRADHTDAILLSGELLSGLGRYDMAEDTFERVGPEDPSYHAAVMGEAEALRDQGDMAGAISTLEDLAEAQPDLAVAQTTLGDLYRQEQRYEEATAAYSRAIELMPEETSRQWFLYYARAIAFERQDKWEEAEADFRHALELNPEQPQVLNYLGYSLVEQERKLDEALNMIERAVAARPNSGYIVDSLGWVLYRLGRYEEAVPHMERAAELMPIDPVVNDHLGDVYWAVGREREAEFMWKRALSFVDWEDAVEEADPERIKRKLDVGLDQVLAEEGAPSLEQAAAQPLTDEEG